MFSFNPIFQLSTAKNEINLFNNHILIVAPVTFAPAGVTPPSAEFLLLNTTHYRNFFMPLISIAPDNKGIRKSIFS